MLKLNEYNKGQLLDFDVGLFNYELEKLCNDSIEFVFEGKLYKITPEDILTRLNKSSFTIEKMLAQVVYDEYVGR